MATVQERFLKYVSFDTKSDEFSETCPSTEKQKLLGAYLVEEMKGLGIADAFMDANGYVYGILAAFAATIAINYAFTFPYFRINFTIPTNLFSAITMIVISVLTSTLTIKVKHQEAVKAESEKERMRANLLRAVSHDLRTPLTTVSGFVQNMLQGTIPQDKLPHYYKIILDEVNRLSRLVQTLLETSRMTAGERKYTFAPMDLCELGRVTILSFEKRLDEKNIEVMFFNEPEDIFVMADQDAIQQVIYNLMDNAIKFTPQEGFLGVTVEIQGQKAIFRVKNSGEGIPEEELSHLFDRFYKSDRSRGLDKKGMGLGLFIVKSILSAHGEEVWVESLYGSYTEFFFSLPLVGGKKGDRPEKA